MNKYPSSYLHTFINFCIGLIALLAFPQCTSCSQPAEPASKPKLQLAATKNLLKEPERSFEVIITAAQGTDLPPLTDLKLQAHFLEQEAFKENLSSSSTSYLAHKKAADKAHFTTSFIIPLTQYAPENEIAAEEEERSELRIPLLLQPDNLATKLKVGIDLLDKQDKLLQSIEVTWIKNQLLISEPTTIKNHEGLLSLTLKNTKDTPLKTSDLILSLKSDHGTTCFFSSTHTSQATLDQLWDQHPTLDPGSKTSPIALQLTTSNPSQALDNLTITIRKQGGKAIATKNLTCPPAHQQDKQTLLPPPPQEPELTTTLPAISLRLVPITNKKFKLSLENTGEQLNTKSLKLVRLTYTIQGPNNTTKAHFKTGNLPDINGASLAELIDLPLLQNQTKELEVILEPGAAESLTIHFSLEGTQNNNLVTFNWRKQEKTTKQTKQEQDQLRIQQPTQGLQDKIAAEKVTTSLPLPHLHLHAQASSTSAKILKLLVTNQGERVSQDDLKNVKLAFTLEGKGDISTAYLKRRGTPQETINGKTLLHFIKSGLDSNQTKEFELILETGHAQALTARITLTGLQNPNTATFSWANKKECQPKHQLAQEPRPATMDQQKKVSNNAQLLQPQPEQISHNIQNHNQQPNNNTHQAIDQEKITQAANNPPKGLSQAFQEVQKEDQQTTNKLEQAIQAEEPSQKAINRLQDDQEEIQQAASNLPTELTQALQEVQKKEDQQTINEVELDLEHAPINEQEEAQKTASYVQGSPKQESVSQEETPKATENLQEERVLTKKEEQEIAMKRKIFQQVNEEAQKRIQKSIQALTKDFESANKLLEEIDQVQKQGKKKKWYQFF